MSQTVLSHWGQLDQLVWAPTSTWLLHTWLPSASKNMVKTQARITPKPRGNFGFRTEQKDCSNLKIGRSLVFLLTYFCLISFQCAFASHLPAFFTTRKGTSLLFTAEYWSSQVKLLARIWALWKNHAYWKTSHNIARMGNSFLAWGLCQSKLATLPKTCPLTAQ